LKTTKPWKPEFLPVEEIVGKAAWFRARYAKDGAFPINIEGIVERHLTMSIDPVPGLRATARTDAYITTDFRKIKVDFDEYFDERYENRLRFSLAHEVGHYVLHYNLYKHLSFASVEEYLDIMANIQEEHYRSFEWQANQFAAHLLVPIEALLPRVLEEKQVHEKARGDKSVPRQAAWNVSLISPTISRFFGVSEEVIERRIQDERLWPYDDKG